MERKCPRTLDRPILMFGLEIEDIALLSFGVGAGSLVIGPMISGLVGGVGWAVLLRLKKNKPAGYVMHWLYSKGFQLPGLIPPMTKAEYYGAYGTNSISKFKIR